MTLSLPSPLARRGAAIAGSFIVVAACAARLTAAAPPSTATGSAPVVELDAYIVEADPFARSADELHQSTSVLADGALATRRTATLGATLDGTPGVTSTYFGPGASRPLIRGLGGERIRVLTNGLGTIDASSQSPDHAVSLDPALIERIEVVRGPSTLLYGSSAVGGVVNVIDRQVPAVRPDGRLSGFVEAGYGTNADERAGIAQFTGAAGDHAWQLSFARRRSADLDIPGFAEHESDEDEAPVHGRLPDSAIATTSGSGGLSWFWGGGFVGAAVSLFDTRYGVPGHAHEHEEEDEESPEEHSGVQIDLTQRRLDLRSEITEPFGPFRSARLRLGHADYEHLELEGDEIGTRFDSRGYEARIDFLHQPLGRFEGAIGAQLQHHRLTAEGEEAFLPPTRTRNAALFAVEELVHDAVRWQFGTRFETQAIAVRDGSGLSRDKDGLSLSAGGVWTISEAWTLAFALARTERLPTAQERFAHGPHAATRAFEICNPDLGKEKSTGLDLSLRRRAGPITGAVSIFVNGFNRYIFEEPTDEEADGFPVYRFVARDARFHGGEAEVTWHLHDGRAHTLDWTVSADFVRARNRSEETALPRTPPWRVATQLEYASERWSAGLSVQHVARQTRLAPLETASSSYVLIGAHIGYTMPLAERSALELFVRGANLADDEARPHTSFLKEVAPLPGRNVFAGARWTF